MNKRLTKITVFFVVFGSTSFILISSQSINNHVNFIEHSIETDEQEIERRNISNISNSFNLSENYLTNNQLKHLDKTELMLLRNEIFARHGYIFKREDLMKYFYQFSWYKPQYTNVSHMLNNVELYNIDKIKQYE